MQTVFAGHGVTVAALPPPGPVADPPPYPPPPQEITPIIIPAAANALTNSFICTSGVLRLRAASDPRAVKGMPRI
jgi:hypothetical protein